MQGRGGRDRRKARHHRENQGNYVSHNRIPPCGQDTLFFPREKKPAGKAGFRKPREDRSTRLCLGFFLPLAGFEFEARLAPRDKTDKFNLQGGRGDFFQLGNLVAFQGNRFPYSPLAAGGRGTVTDRYFVRSRKGGRDDRFPGGCVEDKLPLSPRSRAATEAVFRKCDRPPRLCNFPVVRPPPE